MTKGKATAVLVVVAVLVGSCWLAVLPQENMSAERGFGIGASLTIPPWPFISYCFSDNLSITASGMLLLGTAVLGAGLEYRLLDNRSIDALVSAGGLLFIGPIPSGAVSASAIVEFSPFRSLAIRASAGITFSLTGVSPGYGASIVYYF